MLMDSYTIMERIVPNRTNQFYVIKEPKQSQISPNSISITSKNISEVSKASLQLTFEALQTALPPNWELLPWLRSLGLAPDEEGFTIG